MQVLALIGDIVGSRTLSRRDAWQRRLAAVLAARNQAGHGLASPYTITLGDEFQAVYRQAGSVWLDLVEILAALHPVPVRFALGVGSLTTRVNSRQALGMDGPAFHRAREALTAMKAGPGRIQIAGATTAEWALANHTLALVSHRLAGWSRNRLRVLAGLLRGQPVRELEGELRISRVAIYKNINAAALDEVAAICLELGRQLDTVLREP